MNLKKVVKQSSFCADLMERIHDDITNAKVSYGQIKHHTVIMNDIGRLRRELNDLSNMLGLYGYEEK